MREENPIQPSVLSLVPNYSFFPAVRAAGLVLHILHVVENYDWEFCSSAQNRVEALQCF